MHKTLTFEVPYCFWAPYINDLCYLTTFDEVGVISSEDIMDSHQIRIKESHFNLIVEFNQVFQSDWYKIHLKNIKLHQLSVSHIRQGGHRNYLFVPLTKGCIDFSNMQQFLKQRQDQQRGESLRLHWRNQFLVENSIYYGPLNQVSFCVYKIFHVDQLVKDLFEYYLQHCFEKSFNLEQILQFYNVDESILEKTIFYFVFEHHFENRENQINGLYIIRQMVSENSKIQKDVIAAVKQVTNIQSMRGVDSVRAPIILKMPQINLTPVDCLYQHHFSLKGFNAFISLAYKLLDLEQQMIINEIATRLDLHSPNLSLALTMYLFHQFSPSSTSSQNYQLLETLGDSILKFVSTLQISLTNSSLDENQIDKIRDGVVSNQFLGNLTLQFPFLVSYIQHSQRKWQSPVLRLFETLSISEAVKPGKDLSLKTLADIYEALIGTAFQEKFTLQDAYNFIQRTRHPIAQYFRDTKYFNSESLIIPIIPCSSNATFRQLFPPQVGDIESVLRYTFKNKVILQESLNVVNHGFKPPFSIPLEEYYEVMQQQNQQSPRYLAVLELIGDSVLECFIIVNAFNSLKVPFTPTHLHKCKINLLSNSFFAKMAINLGFHRHIPQTQEINDFLRDCDLTQDMRKYNANFVKVPKVLSDVFEAICGAVLIDGGITAFIEVYGRLFQGLMSYVFTYIDEMETHVVERLHQYLGQCTVKYTKLQQGIRCDIHHDGKIIGSAEAGFQKVAKEKAAEAACLYLKI